MANQEQLDILKQSVQAWNAWREVVGVQIDLIEANLSGEDLDGANLNGSNLTGAILNHANLNNATLRGAHLRGVYLIDANLIGADLTYADLSGAHLAYTVLGDVDLSTVKGLETVKHHAPSIISIDTIYNSQGKIPEMFLKGAGVPDSFIEYVHSLVGKPIDFYSCFISYSKKDQVFAERLHADLEKQRRSLLVCAS